MKITSILLWVQENRLSEKFYKKLGFIVTHSTDSESIVSLDGFAITLVSMRDDEEFARDAMSGDKGRGMYIYIRVDDVDEAYRRYIAAGIVPRSEPRDWEWGNREFVVKDPDGYKLCLWQPVAAGS